MYAVNELSVKQMHCLPVKAGRSSNVFILGIKLFLTLYTIGRMLSHLDTPIFVNGNCMRPNGIMSH
jgi:hypothetical protein